MKVTVEMEDDPFAQLGRTLAATAHTNPDSLSTVEIGIVALEPDLVNTRDESELAANLGYIKQQLGTGQTLTAVLFGCVVTISPIKNPLV